VTRNRQNEPSGLQMMRNRNARRQCPDVLFPKAAKLASVLTRLATVGRDGCSLRARRREVSKWVCVGPGQWRRTPPNHRRLRTLKQNRDYGIKAKVFSRYGTVAPCSRPQSRSAAAQLLLDAPTHSNCARVRLPPTPYALNRPQPGATRPCSAHLQLDLADIG